MIVDLDLLFQISQKDAKIIGGKGEEASSSGSTIKVNFVLKNPKKRLGRSIFYRKTKYECLGQNE
jgi:hypothetical protein